MGRFERSAETVRASVLLAALCWTEIARAEPMEQPIRIQYSAAEDCPDSLAFFWQVRARTQRVRLAAPGELAALVVVTMAPESIHTVGTLTMPDERGAPFVRRVEADSCEEVALALSLVLALAFDPDAVTAFQAAPAAPLAPLPLPQPRLLASGALPERDVRNAPGVPSPVGVALGVSSFLMSGLSPAVEPVFGPFLEYGVARDSGWTPRLAAAFFVSPNQTVTVEPSRRTASLQFFGARLTGCPVSVEILPGLTGSPCVAFDAGRISGNGGSGVESSHAGGILWLSVAGLAQLRWKVAAPLFVELDGGGGPTLFHNSFGLNGPKETVHTIPAGVVEAGLGVGVRFP